MHKGTWNDEQYLRSSVIKEEALREAWWRRKRQSPLFYQLTWIMREVHHRCSPERWLHSCSKKMFVEPLHAAVRIYLLLYVKSPKRVRYALRSYWFYSHLIRDSNLEKLKEIDRETERKELLWRYSKKWKEGKAVKKYSLPGPKSKQSHMNGTIDLLTSHTVHCPSAPLMIEFLTWRSLQIHYSEKFGMMFSDTANFVQYHLELDFHFALQPCIKRS